MKILFSTSSLFPYRVDWLDELGKYADVDVYYLMNSDADRNTEWCAKRPKNCTYTLLNSIHIPIIGLVSRGFVNILNKHWREYDAIILDGYGFPSQLLNIKYLNRHGIKYYVNIDGIVPKYSENPIIFWIKKKIISKIPYIFCGAKTANEGLIRYGAKQENIINHHFTSLYEKDVASSISTKDQKLRTRDKLGIQEERVIVSVGRFSYMNGYGKGYDVLLRTARNMSPNVGWYIVGGNPTEEFKKMKQRLGTHNVHFVDFLTSDELADYYEAADVFVLMTVSDVWGLVINEAMSHGLPIITTDKCVAGLDLVVAGENGYIVKVGDDVSLQEKLEIIFASQELKDQMSRISLSKIKLYTIEEMARIHIKAIKDINNHSKGANHG